MSSIDFDGIVARNVYFSHSEHYQKSFIIENLNINIPRGKIYGLIGPSGCGKTTLLRCIFGYYKPDQGEIKVFGKPAGDATLSIPGHNLGYAPQDECLTDDITAREMITFCGRLNAMKKCLINPRINQLNQILDIQDLDKLVRNLTGGQKRRLSLACALVYSPKLLLLDEPTVGSDPLLRRIIWDYLETLTRTQGTTIVVTTHYLEEVKDANRVGFMCQGKILEEGNPKTVLNKYRVKSLEDAAFKIYIASEESPQRGQNWHGRDNQEVNNNSIPCEVETSGREKRVEVLNQLTDDRTQSRVGINFQIVIQLMLRMFHRREFTLFYPIVISVILNWYLSVLNYISYGIDPVGLSVGFVREIDSGNLTVDLIERIESRGLKVIPFDDEEDAREAALERLTEGYFVAKSGFSREVSRQLSDNFRSSSDFRLAQLHYHGDEVNLIKSYYVKETLSRSFASIQAREAEKLKVNHQILKFFRTEPIYGKKSEENIWTIREAFHLRIVMITLVGYSCATTLFWIPQDREEKFFERLAASGINPRLAALSYILTALTIVIPCSQVSLTLIRLTAKLDIVEGSIYIYHIVFALISWSGLSMGLVTGSLPLKSKSMYGYVQAGYVMTSFWCSGIVSSYQFLPYFMSWVKYLFPISLVGDTLTEAMVKGHSIAEYTVYSGLLFALGHNIIYTGLFVLLMKY